MSVVIAGAVVAAVLVATSAVLGVVGVVRARRSQPPDGLLRAGSSPEVDAATAALRASGTNAWMRGGGL